MSKDYKIYGQSKKGNFKIIDELPTPHPYCITAKHVEIASDHFGGMLGESAIERAEEQGVVCDICRKLVRDGKQKEVLKFKQHEKALLVECKAEIAKDKLEKDGKRKMNPELFAWLKSIQDLASKNGYAGFAFKNAVKGAKK